MFTEGAARQGIIAVHVDDRAAFGTWMKGMANRAGAGTIATEQFEMLCADMLQEYESGNYCIAGGDFNKDLLGASAEIFGVTGGENDTWAQPIPEDTFDGFNVSLIAPLDEGNPVPSCRNADGPYHQGQYVLTVDGFLVSENVTVTSSDVVDLGFAYSDHNPVEMRFVLEK